MTTLVINSTDSLQRVFGELREAFGIHKFLRLNLKTGKDRSISFNDLSHAWYQQLARELPQDDEIGWKCFAKLNFGVPIMRAADNQFREFYDLSIKSSLSYEQKLTAMKYLPVSSLMTNPKFKRYCETMQAHFIEQGVFLEFPPEDKSK